MNKCNIYSVYLLFRLMVKFGPSVFYLFSPSVEYSVLQFSIYSVIWIRSTVQVQIFAFQFQCLQRCLAV